MHDIYSAQRCKLSPAHSPHAHATQLLLWRRGTLSILIECSPRNCAGESLTLVAWSSRQKLCRNTTNIIIWRQSNVLNYLLLLMRTLEVRKNILRHFCIRCLAHHHKTCRLGPEPSNEVYIRQIMRICKIYSRNRPSLQAVFFCTKIQVIEHSVRKLFNIRCYT